ncbi:early nodulin-like protein 6 [Nicotiana tabacum]|uniref:Early nodulin-like protein 1 n=1 Tax=Nicotiana tabacum TaxID=4097 RepID=A0A1S3XTE1_TOBAC|nr:PREDICTED: early nodulin-like protein 1 [Nicotiana tabacum]
MALFRFNAFIFSLVFTSIFATTIFVSSFQFEIGGEIGWSKPIGNESETYNEWAAKNRFHIGDSLYFKYKGDSVLEVTPADYLNCNTSNPISKFEDGDTVFKFNRSGFFYFISGHKNHCKSGQRLIIRVMHPFESETASPGTAPAIAPTVAAGGGDDGGDGWASDFLGPPAINSTTAISVFSYFVTALGGVMVFLYLLM